MTESCRPVVVKLMRDFDRRSVFCERLGSVGIEPEKSGAAITSSGECADGSKGGAAGSETVEEAVSGRAR